MRVMRSLGAALIWLLGVVLVASVSWVAINSAGRQVVDNVDVAAADPWAADAPGDAPGDALRATPAAPSSTTTPPTPVPTSSPTGHESGGASSTSGSTHGVTGSTSATPTSPRPSTNTSTTRVTPVPAPVSATQQTDGGSVWMECTGQVVSNSLALPNDGWSATRSQHTPADLSVHFSRSSSRIEVDGSCVAGRPHFSVKSDHGDD
jgi:hypothetical protein